MPDNQGYAWVVRERRGAISRHHRLPLSTYSEYAAARGHEHRDLKPGDVETEDRIGPHAVFGDELWRVRYGELNADSGGLVRFDRATRTFHLVGSGLGIGCRFLSAGDRLLLGTNAGVTIVHGDEISHVMFDETSDGRVRVVASER